MEVKMGVEEGACDSVRPLRQFAVGVDADTCRPSAINRVPTNATTQSVLGIGTGVGWARLWFFHLFMSSSPSFSLSSPRSPSPRTPEDSEYADSVAIHSDVGLSSSWYMSMAAKVAQQSWAMDPLAYHSPSKGEDNDMLRLDDLIEQDAYDECVRSSKHRLNLLTVPPSVSSPSPSHASSSSAHPSPPTHHKEALSNYSMLQPDLRPTTMLVASQNGLMTLTKPIPPPASLPRKLDPSAMNQRVIHPAKDSCYKCVFRSIKFVLRQLTTRWR